MERLLRGRIAPVLLATAALIGAADLGAYAGGGNPLLLGQHNIAAQATGLRNSGKGPALKLDVDPASPPLIVNSKRVVRKLNADLVDGLDGKALQTTSYHFTLPTGTQAASTSLALPHVPGGTYLASFSLLAISSATDQVSCGFTNTTSGLPFRGVGYGVLINNSTNVFSASGSALLTSSPSHPIALSCFSSSPFRIDPDKSSVSGVDLVRIDKAVTHAAVPQN